ncbi:MAG: tetratricopeptide repeat protein [Deltaproteobacteria bacterium]|nr:tetratricopeptide repeat protein [Deltaproteobacteria bacterium]
MSVEPLRCKKCDVECTFERAGRFPGTSASTFGVGWRCPRCDGLSLDLCPVGPLVPSARTCLNCGGGFPADEMDPRCPGCGMRRTESIEWLGPFPGPEAFKATVIDLVRRGLIRSALAVANHALVSDIARADAWTMKYRILRELGMREAILEMMGAAFDAGLPRPLLVSYGCELYDAKLFEQSLAVHDRYLVGPADDWTAAVLANKANSLAALGRDEEARVLYDEAISRQPGLLSHRLNLIHLCIRRKEWDQAVAAIDASLGLEVSVEERARLFEDRAFIFAEQDRGEEALAAAQEAVRLAPEHPRARYNRGRALALVGRLEEARAEMQWVLGRDARHRDAKRAIGMIDEALALRKPSLWRRFFGKQSAT